MHHRRTVRKWSDSRQTATLLHDVQRRGELMKFIQRLTAGQHDVIVRSGDVTSGVLMMQYGQRMESRHERIALKRIDKLLMISLSYDVCTIKRKKK